MTSGPADPGLLDDPEALGRADRGGLLRATAIAGAQVRASLAVAADPRTGLAQAAEDGRPRSVVLAGNGVGAAAGDLVACLLGPSCQAPIAVTRGGVLPGWAGPVDLVVAVADTDDAHAAADEAVRRGCRLATVGGPGSPLAERAQRARGIHLPVDIGTSPPRADLWALAAPLVLLAGALGLVPDPRRQLEETADLLDTLAVAYGPAAPSYDNPAKALALELLGSIPVVWATTDLTAAAARRLAAQLAVSARRPALSGVLADVVHDQLAVLAGPLAAETEDDIFRDRVEEPQGSVRLRVVLLRDASEPPHAAELASLVEEVAERYGVAISEVPAPAGSPVQRLAGLIAIGDFAAAYAGLLDGIDVTASTPTTLVKERSTR